MHSIERCVNKGERKDSAMPTLDKAKAWSEEGHKEKIVLRWLPWKKEEIALLGFSYFTLASVTIVGGPIWL